MSIHLKRLSIICVLAIFLIGANSNSNELKSSKNENHISFETLQTMIQDLNERLSRLEEKSQQEEKQHHDPNSDNALKMNSMAKVNKRLSKIEKAVSSLEIKEIQKTLTSFEGTLDVFKNRFSNISKSLEDSEINAAVIERMYRETQDYTEPPESTVSKAREGQSQIVNEDSVDIVKTENAENLKKPKAFKELIESGGLKQSAESKALTKSKVSQNIDNSFSTKNITFDKYESSSIVKGEIKNNSGSDITSASFVMKLFDKNERMIAEFDFHIKKIASNTIKSFEETVREVLPSQISRYEIKCRNSF